MTPKEEAIQLVKKFYFEISTAHERNKHAKECALICVDEILKTAPQTKNEIFAISKGIKYWQEVKQEIKKL